VRKGLPLLELAVGAQWMASILGMTSPATVTASLGLLGLLAFVLLHLVSVVAYGKPPPPN